MSTIARKAVAWAVSWLQMGPVLMVVACVASAVWVMDALARMVG